MYVPTHHSLAVGQCHQTMLAPRITAPRRMTSVNACRNHNLDGSFSNSAELAETSARKRREEIQIREQLVAMEKTYSERKARDRFFESSGMGGESQGREGDVNTKPTTYGATMTGLVTLADLKPIPAEHTPGDMTRQTRSGAQYSGRQFPLMATPGGGMRYKP